MKVLWQDVVKREGPAGASDEAMSDAETDAEEQASSSEASSSESEEQSEESSSHESELDEAGVRVELHVSFPSGSTH